MSLRLGRAVLRAVQDSDLVVEPGEGIGTRKTRVYTLSGSQHGSTAQADVDLLARESRRHGCMWVEDDEASLVAGHYRVEAGAGYEQPGGAPKHRPWTATLREYATPDVVTRQGESDNNAGTDTPEEDSEEGTIVSVTPVTTVIALRPRLVAAAEKFNLPAGTWQAVLRHKPTVSTLRYYWRLTNLAGTTLSTSAGVLTSPSTQWVESNLGILTVPWANSRANWYELDVEDFLGSAGATSLLDRIRFYPVASV